ncbi:UNVERIFIED_CONTAM: hypothetical protein GTU68_015586 [Idotea baltica]|nr:hypothetical protein [Idotea baltica]
MMDAKKALTAAEGDFEAAVQILREKGLAKAATRSDRDNSEGLVAVAQNDTGAALVHLKSETDFAAKSDGFQTLAKELAELVLAKAKPSYLSRDEVPAEEIEKERAALLEITKTEGKPEAAWDKIVEGRLNSWLGERVLLEQGVFGDKETVAAKIGDGTITRFTLAQVGA